MRSTLVKKHGTANIGSKSKLKKPDPLSLTASQASFTFTFSHNRPLLLSLSLTAIFTQNQTIEICFDVFHGTYHTTG